MLNMNSLFLRKNPALHSPGERTAAVLAAGAVIVMALAALGAYAVIHGRLVVQGDGLATAGNIRAAKGLFSLEICLWVMIAAADMMASFALWRFFARVDRRLSAITAATRILYSLSLIAGIVHLVFAAGSLDPLRDIDLFERLWSAGLIVFGLHLTLLAWICFRSGFVPGIWSWLLVIAGPSYMLIHSLKNLGPVFAQASAALETVLSVPMTVAEVGFAAWLLVRAFSSLKVETLPQREGQSA
jgi:hypothetical protein